MRKLILDILVVEMMLGVAALALASPSNAQYAITEIIDSTAGGGAPLLQAHGVAVDSSGNVYVAGYDYNNAFKIATPGTCSTNGTPCTITEIIDGLGDREGNYLEKTHKVAVDSSGNVYVNGAESDNAFRIATPGTCSTTVPPGCTITEIIDATGDGGGHTVYYTSGVAVDSNGNVYVNGGESSNAFKITPGGTITEIIDSMGDGGGNTLDNSSGVAVDSSGNVYVVGFFSRNVFKIATPGTCSTSGTPCTITEIIHGGIPFWPIEVAVDSSGNVYVTGGEADNAFKIATPGTCSTSGTPCTITEIIDSTGDGGGNTLDLASGVSVDSSGNVYVTGGNSDNAFKLQPVSQVPVLSNRGLLVLGASLLCVVFWLARRHP